MVNKRAEYLKIKDLKTGMFVWDRWFPEWGVGKIIKILKTRTHIKFNRRGLLRYDRAHIKFLEKEYENTYFKVFEVLG